jgi:hypothetical protein
MDDQKMTLFSRLFEQASAQAARSTVLQPLAWIIVSLFAALSVTASFRPESWVLIFLAVLLVIILGIYVGAYIYCMWKDPDLLRSEKFYIQKFAIERGVFGDSTKGIIIQNSNEDKKVLDVESGTTLRDDEDA